MDQNGEREKEYMQEGVTAMTCPKCGAEVLEGLKFCGSCGAQLVRTCRKCGSPLAPGLKFCGECGTPWEETPGTHEQPKEPACPKCGAMIPDGRKFCVKCGAQVVQFCPSCGSQQTLGAPFCGTCGASMTGAAGEGTHGLKPVGFLAAWKRGWKFSAKGRASRGEYWWRMLSVLLEMLALGIVLFGIVAGIMFEWRFRHIPDEFFAVISIAYALWLLPMSIALLLLRIRRLHDQGLSGWWVLLWNTPPAPPIIGLIFSLRSGTAGPNKFGPVPGIRPTELQAAEAQSTAPVPTPEQPRRTRRPALKQAAVEWWRKAGEADLQFEPKIRKIFLILAGCLATIGFFWWERMYCAPPWGVDIFRTCVPFVGFLLLALPEKSVGHSKTGMVLEVMSAIIVFVATVGSVIDSYSYSAWNLVWPVCFGAFLIFFKRQGAKKICAWVLAGWCLLWCFNSDIRSFWEHLLMFGQCALWGLIALMEGRPGLVSGSQKPEEERKFREQTS